ATANRGLMSGAERDHLWGGVGRAQLERSVRTLAVVMVDVLAQDAIELTTAADEQPVEALLTQGANEALGMGVGVGRPDRRVNDPDSLGPEDLVERGAELRVAVVDQEAHRPLPTAAVDHEVARLLGDPRPTRVPAAARKVDAPRVQLDEEQHIHAPQPDGVDGQEVARDHALRLCP